AAFIGHDHVRAVYDCLHAATAQAIDRQRWRFNRQPRSQSHMTGTVQCVAGSLLRIAENGVIEFFRLDARALDRLLGGNRAEFLRRKVFQLAAITSERRACAANDRNVTWLEHEVRQNGAVACSELVSLAA